MRLRLITPLLLGLFLFVCAGAGERAGANETYQLLTTGRELAGGESIAVRFTSKMVGNPVDADPGQSPLEIQPHVPFVFEWLSSQTGRIVFTEAPPLATKLRVLPQRNLRTLSGESVEAPSADTLTRTTPAHGLIDAKSNGLEQGILANASVNVAFNFEPDVSSLNAGVVFVSDRGEVVRAKAVPLMRQNQWELRPLTWNESFAPVYRGKTQAASEGKNRFTFTPQQPLLPQRSWRLQFGREVVDSRSPNLLPFPSPYLHRVGRVEDLAIRRATFGHEVLGEQEIRIEFNKALASPGELARIRLTGADARWSFARGANVLAGTIRAAAGQVLRLSVPAGLLAADGTRLAQPFEQEIRVKGLPARLYFDNFLARQFTAGTRILPLMGVNVDRVTLRIQRIPPSEAAMAMKRWNDYRVFESADRPAKRGNRFDEEFTGVNQRNQRIDLALPESATVCVRQVQLQASGDAQEREVLLSWDELIGARESGMFLVTAEALLAPGDKKNVGAQTLVQLTDIGLVSWIHEEGKGATCHAYSLANGKPLEGVECVFFNGKYEPVERGMTDAQGMVTATKPASRWLAASLGGDVTTLGLNYLWNEEDGKSQSDENTPAGSAIPRMQAFAFLDRDIYRPGETLHAKAFFREVTSSGLKLPSPFEFSLKLVDERDRVVFERSETSGKEGSWTMDLPLPEKEGRYSLLMNRALGGFANTQELSFTIASFQEDKFQLNVLTSPELAAGRPFEAQINASYLSGQPLNGANGVWTLRGVPEPFHPHGFDGFTFGFGFDIHFNDSVLKEDRTAHSLEEQGQVTLDAKGAHAIALDLQKGRKFTCPVALEFGLEVTDASQQTLFSGQRVLLHSSDFYLGVQSKRSWVRAGEDIPLNVIAVGTDGAPLRTNNPVEFTVERITQSKVLYEADGETRQVDRFTFTPVSKHTAVLRNPELVGDRWILPHADPSLLLRFNEGRYILSVRTFDGARRPVQTRVLLDVGPALNASEVAASRNFNDEDDDSVFTIVPDKESRSSPYHVGETAQLLVTSEKPGNALLTVQSGKVLRTQLLSLVEKNTRVEVPLLAEDVPQVRVNVTRFRGLEQSLRKVKKPSLNFTDTVLHVVPSNTELGVTVTGLPREALPRTQLKPEVVVTQTDGAPASGAEVTLYAVDEGVLRMSGYKTPEPLSGVFDGYINRLYRASNASLFQSEAHDPREGYYNKGFVVGGGGDDGGDVRGNFPLTVFWLANGKTDFQGRLRVSFAAPENLSQFRVMAVVAHGTSAFGSGDASFRVQKNLQIQSGTPQIARAGDRLWLRGIVQNSTDIPAEVEVELKGGGEMRILGGDQKRFRIAARSTEPVEFEAEFLQAGTASLEWRVRGLNKEGRDSMTSRIVVEHATPLVTETFFAKLEPGQQEEFGERSTLLHKQDVRVNVQLSALGRAQLQGRVRVLLHYPYGCAEQTVSSTLPWLLAGELEIPELEASKVPLMVARGLARLEDMQTGSGGIAYWPKSTQPMPFASAYAGVLVALIEAYDGGSLAKRVDASFRARLVEYLKALVRSPESPAIKANTSSQCMALYALAALNETELGAQERMLRDADFLAGDERTLLALAFIHTQGGEKTARDLLLVADQRESSDEFGSLERDKALRLLAWTRLGGVPADSTSILGELLAGAAPEAASTQCNAWTLWALSKALPVETKVVGAIRGRVEIQGTTSSFNLGGAGNAPVQTEVSADWNAQKKDRRIRLQNDSSKPLFSLVSISGRDETPDAPALRQGYSLRRTFEKLDAQNNPSPATELKPGDRVRVKLEVNAHQGGAYLALYCPLPANLEPIQTFVSRQSGASARAESDNFSDYREVRSGGIVCFQNLLRRGTHTVEVITRVRAAGVAVAPAARIEEMYHPERFGQTVSERFSVGH